MRMHSLLLLRYKWENATMEPPIKVLFYPLISTTSYCTMVSGLVLTHYRGPQTAISSLIGIVLVEIKFEEMPYH